MSRTQPSAQHRVRTPLLSSLQAFNCIEVHCLSVQQEFTSLNVLTLLLLQGSGPKEGQSPCPVSLCSFSLDQAHAEEDCIEGPAATMRPSLWNQPSPEPQLPPMSAAVAVQPWQPGPLSRCRVKATGGGSEWTEADKPHQHVQPDATLRTPPSAGTPRPLLQRK